MKIPFFTGDKRTGFISRSRLGAAMAVCSIGCVLSAEAISVVVEAESGTLGADYTREVDGSVNYIAISTDLINGDYPGSADRVATYNVTFPAPGNYDLYARVRAGINPGNDDSLFYGNGFGLKSVTTGSQWIKVNSLDNGGYTNESDIVGGSGTAGTGEWKWINLSDYIDRYSEAPVSFTVSEGELEQVFQIGGREDGLDIDKLVFGSAQNTFTVAQLDAGDPGSVAPQQDVVHGNLIQFSQNGIWCWFQDERAVVDTNANKLVVGYIQNKGGLGGSGADGDVSAAIWDVERGTATRSVLKHALLSYGGGDDHNAPAMEVLPNGKYIAMYSGHNNDYNTFYRIYDPANGLWSPEETFDWSAQPGGADFKTSYNNTYYLADEGRVYNLSRGNGAGSPNIMTSTDMGETWSYGGQLTFNDIPGYVQGYFRYWGNGTDRIDFICTEAHPGDYSTSMFHGYISNGMSYDSFGNVLDTNVLDKLDIPRPSDFTPVFTAGTVMPTGQTNSHCWNIDTCRYPDGSVSALISTRINDNGTYLNHAFFFCRFDGAQWNTTYLCQAGYPLYSSQKDYTGLGALDPNDPNTIYISTKFDPRQVVPGTYDLDENREVSTVHEIWRGVTTNQGAGFAWAPVTQNSVQANLRPIMPEWSDTESVLLWYRGNYITAQNSDAAIVGIVEDRSEIVGSMQYMDATTNNTTLTGGAPLLLDPAANNWHLQDGVGNGSTIISSSDAIAETPPELMTQVTLTNAGVYDLWVNFWGNPVADWRIEAGLDAESMQIFRSSRCQQVRAGTHDSALVTTNSATGAYLYQAYLGRVTVTNDPNVDIYIRGNTLQTGGDGNTFVGDTCRTWYDGISYARVESLQIEHIDFSDASDAAVVWNSTPPDLSLTPQTFTLWKASALSESNHWEQVASGIESGGYTTTNMGAYASESSAYYRVSQP